MSVQTAKKRRIEYDQLDAETNNQTQVIERTQEA